jgi:hypothetical protein
MKSVFDTIDESRAEPYSTHAFADAFARTPARRRDVALAAALLRSHFLTGPGWRFHGHEASITFQQAARAERTVKVFVDSNNELAERAGLNIYRDPVAVGVALTTETPFLRERVRDFLAATFRDYYLDPRAPRHGCLEIVTNVKYWIVPHPDFLYDIVFMPPVGRLKLEADERLVEMFVKRLGGTTQGS